MPHRLLMMISSMRGGGSEQQTLLLLRHLDRDRFEPHLYLTERAGDLLNRVPEDVTIHSFDAVRSSGGIYIPGRAIGQQINHVATVLQSAEIDVIYDRTFHMTLIAGPASRRCTPVVPRVSTIVSPPEYALPAVESRFVSMKRRRLSRAYRQAARVVAVSRQAAESAERFYGLRDRTVDVVHNPVDRDFLVQSSANDRPSRDQRLTLACVGRMTPEKGHQDLLAAVIRSQDSWPEDHPPLRLWMIGDGPLREQLVRQWMENQRQHSVEFLGTQSCPQSYIAAADALVLPSHFEGMPNVILEAMALKTPVIATRAGGTVELERDAPTILWAQPGDPESLLKAIIALALDPQAAATRATSAEEMIRRHHDAVTTTRRIEDLLLAAL